MPDANSLAPEPLRCATPSTYGRAWVRHSPRQQTACHLLSIAADECWPATVENLSQGGVGLWLDRRIDPGRFVLVELMSASGLFSRLLLTRVVHLSPHGDGYLLGGEFITELPAEEVRLLLA